MVAVSKIHYANHYLLRELHCLLVMVRKSVCLLSQHNAAPTIELFDLVNQSSARVQEQTPRTHGHDELQNQKCRVHAKC